MLPLDGVCAIHGCVERLLSGSSHSLTQNEREREREREREEAKEVDECALTEDKPVSFRLPAPLSRS